MLENDEKKRNYLLVICLDDGEEKEKLCQEILRNELCIFLSSITGGKKTPKKYDAVERILNIMYPDGNLMFHHQTLQYNYLSKSFCLCYQGKYDEALAELKKSRYHAERMTEFCSKKIHKYTSPFFNLLEDEHKDLPITTDVEDFIQSLNNNTCFDPIRDTEEFQSLLVK